MYSKLSENVFNDLITNILTSKLNYLEFGFDFNLTMAKSLATLLTKHNTMLEHVSVGGYYDHADCDCDVAKVLMEASIDQQMQSFLTVHVEKQCEQLLANISYSRDKLEIIY